MEWLCLLSCFAWFPFWDWIHLKLGLGFCLLRTHLGLFFFFSFILLRATPAGYGSSRLGVKSELEPLAYATAIATRDPSHVCNLHYSSGECWILNPLSEARDWVHILTVTSQVHHHWAAAGTPGLVFFQLTLTSRIRLCKAPNYNYCLFSPILAKISAQFLNLSAAFKFTNALGKKKKGGGCSIWCFLPFLPLLDLRPINLGWLRSSQTYLVFLFFFCFFSRD